MPFDWLEQKRVKLPDRRRDMYRHELEERALLLRRLRYDDKSIQARLRANVAWDFEVGAGKPVLDAAEIDRIVESTRRGHVGGGAPTL